MFRRVCSTQLNDTRRGRHSQAAGRHPFHADSHPSFLLLPFPQTLPSAFIQTGIQIFAKHETNFKMSKNNFLKPNSSLNSKRLFHFPKKNPASFLHFCNRSQSHSWSLVSSRGHFNEALLPWRKKVLHWSSDRMWSNLCTGLWNALHFAVATSFVHFCCKSFYSYAYFVFVHTCTYCALKEELHESICVEGGE